MNLFNQKSTAVLSDCGRYRYELYRKWDASRPEVAFIMLNPSTADASINDNTIKKIMAIAAHNGYGSLWVYNLFAYRATDPGTLKKVADPEGPLNKDYLQKIIFLQYDVVFAWGATPIAQQVAKKVIEYFPDALCLKINFGGSPKHPLYCRNDSKFIKFKTDVKAKPQSHD